MQKTKLNELLEFPCDFPYKVVGIADEELTNNVMSVIHKHAPGEYTPTLKKSTKGNYHSVTVMIKAKNIEQVEILYKELANIDGVKMVL